MLSLFENAIGIVVPAAERIGGLISATLSLVTTSRSGFEVPGLAAFLVVVGACGPSLTRPSSDRGCCGVVDEHRPHTASSLLVENRRLALYTRLA
jgi:hypothetical protein